MTIAADERDLSSSRFSFRIRAIFAMTLHGRSDETVLHELKRWPSSAAPGIPRARLLITTASPA